MKRRVVAGLGAFILMVALVAFPLRARAMSAAAVAASVGGATLIAAYMAACGIYPYSEDGQSFGEWGARALTDLVEQYNQNRLERQIQIAQLTGYVAGRTIAIARDTWDKLREFVSWCRETFSLADNQTGVSFAGSGSLELPVFSVGVPTFQELFSNGISSAGHTSSSTFYALASMSGIYIAAVRSGGDSSVSSYYFFTSYGNLSLSPRVYSGYNVSDSVNSASLSTSYPTTVGGARVLWNNRSGFLNSRASELVCPVFNTRDELLDYAVSVVSGDDVVSSGITVDTSTVSIPAELPEDDDTEWVGLSVYPGTVTGVAGTDNPATVLTPQAVERIIQQGVEERQRPDVRPVEVEIGEGVTVDEETGELVAAEPGTVVITETDIPLSLGDYAIPSLSTVFPFSIPWDIMRVWQALDAEPRFPLQDFSMTLTVPWLFGDSPPTVRFGLDALGPEVAQKMDELAFMVRSFLLVIACVGFLIFISQFIKF